VSCVKKLNSIRELCIGVLYSIPTDAISTNAIPIKIRVERCIIMLYERWQGLIDLSIATVDHYMQLIICDLGDGSEPLLE